MDAGTTGTILKGSYDWFERLSRSIPFDRGMIATFASVGPNLLSLSQKHRDST